MTDTEVATNTLTVEDLTALKLADGVIFEHYLSGSERVCRVRLLLDGGYGDAPVIFTAKQQRLFPEVSQYTRDRVRYIAIESGSVEGHYYVQSAKYTPAFQTTVRHLRVGDELIVNFRPDAHTNDYLRKVDLHGDVCDLTVITRRMSANPHGIREVYLIGTSTTPNNSARMCRNV
jgi:hypothetical protein